MIRQCSVLGMIALVAGCSGGPSGNGTLSTGPDPFGVLPSKPLEAPADFQTLPQPVLGAANRTDATPLGDAAAALGGRPASRGIPAADQALLAAVGRNGVDANIRAELGAGVGSRLFGGNRVLDAQAELERLRILGITTPTAPPAP
ncbi:MAG: DUF3035 domain-containing protein [Planktomarina sp.]